MTTDWMQDVLADLRTFAAMNGMGELERKLGETAEVARRSGGAAYGDNPMGGALCATGYEPRRIYRTA